MGAIAVAAGSSRWEGFKVFHINFSCFSPLPVLAFSVEAEKYNGGLISAEGRNEEPEHRTQAGKRTEVGGGQWEKVLGGFSSS